MFIPASDSQPDNTNPIHQYIVNRPRPASNPQTTAQTLTGDWSCEEGEEESTIQNASKNTAVDSEISEAENALPAPPSFPVAPVEPGSI